ncbi:MAG: mechanosensitive ion channel [Planctomycetota bacterium]
MPRSLRLALLCVWLLLGAVPARGQDPLDDARPTIAQVESRIAGLAEAALEPTEKAAAEAAYRQALDVLRQAEDLTARGADFARLADEAPGKLAAYRAELASPLPALPLDAPLTPSQLEQERARASGELTVAKELIEKLRAETSLRSDRRASLPGNLARLRQQLGTLEETLRAAPRPEAEPGRAEYLRSLAQRAALRAEISAAEQELSSYDARQDLLGVRRDRAQRKYTIAERELEYWQRRLDDQRRADAEAAARETERQRQAALSIPRLRALAEANQALATARSDDGGWVDRLERAAKDLTQARAQLDTLRENFRALRRRERAAGLNQAMGAILRKRYAETLDPFQLRRAVWNTQADLAQAEVASIEYGEQREGAGDLEQELARLEADTPLEGAAREVALQLIEARRDLLEAALGDTERLALILIDLDATRRELQQANAEFRAYMEERILWVRSAQNGVIASPKQVEAFGRWLFDAAAWAQAFRLAFEHFGRNPFELAFGVFLLLLLGAGYGLARTTLSAPATRVSIQLTLRKLLRVALIGLPLPGVVLLFALALGRPPAQIQPAVAVSALLRHVALAAYFGWVLYGLLVKKGVGADLRWPEGTRAYLRKHLVWFFPLRIVLGSVVTGFESQPHAEWADSLGRIAFCLGEVVLWSYLYLTLRHQSPVVENLRERRGEGILLKLRPLWYPFAVGTPLVLIVLSLAGYTYTALHLERRLLGSLLVVVILMTAYGIAIRWLLLARRQVAQQQIANLAPVVEAEAPSADDASPGQAPEDAPAEGQAPEDAGLSPLPPHAERPASAAATGTPDAPPAAPAAVRPGTGRLTETGRYSREGEGSTIQEREADAIDLAAIREQTGRLFRSMAAVALLIALWAIWADVLPALKRLEQVQLWPTVDLVPAEEQHYPALEKGWSAEQAAVDAPADDAAEGAAEAPAAPTPTLSPTLGPRLPTTPAADASPAPAAVETRVTLLHLGLALFALGLTFLVAQNLPGLLELVLLQRLPLDAGARYALISVTRYAVVFVGVTFALGKLGVSWASIQWLAAALTFGLAFGLQEIFANFVSGLILLAERPIRVGDTVTVAGINGKVAKIRIRATTIEQWNGKELVIPNKTFVTGDVVNWTLTNPSLRLDIPIGVAYGTPVPFVQELLTELAGEHPDVLKDPPIKAVFLGFGASSLDLELRVWLPSPNEILPVRDALLVAIQEAFAAHGIEIAFPQQDLHVRSGALEVKLQGQLPGPEGPSLSGPAGA